MLTVKNLKRSLKKENIFYTSQKFSFFVLFESLKHTKIIQQSKTMIDFPPVDFLPTPFYSHTLQY